jgi:putative nucleotidyltransferase with HDIG domain
MLSLSIPAAHGSQRDRRIRLTILLVTGLLTVVALNAPISIRSGLIPQTVGDVAAQDIQAPRAITYQSDVLTEQAVQQARLAVPAVYLPSDPAVKRQQLEELRVNLLFISTVRGDPYSTRDQKISDLQSLQAITLSNSQINSLLDMSESRWQVIYTEAEKVLEVVFRGTIRDANLSAQRGDLPTLVDANFSQSQADLVAALTAPFVVPNSLYSQELTEQARDEAAAAVQPVFRKYELGQIIIQHGQVIGAEDLEALQATGLVNAGFSLPEILGSLSLVAVLSLFLVLFALRRGTSPMDSNRGLLLIAITFLFFLILGRLLIPYRAILPFLFPVAAFGLTLASAFTLEAGFIFTLILGILLPYGLPGSLEMTIYYLAGSFIGIFVLSRGRSLASFFRASLAVGAANMLVIFAYRISNPVTDWVGMLTLISASLVNGIISASFTILLQFLYSQLLGITTPLQLLDLSRPDHPLLQFMLRNAPGSYQHSLQVANLAEQAADAIHADSLLVRVGAQYHDVGKAVNPQLFIENQVKGSLNPHDDLTPVESAELIIRHVADGLSLARKYHLTPRLQDFITEHHGTLLTRFQYNRALAQVGNDETKVDRSLFRYPGPAPRSRETAILMLADGCEARARAELPHDEAGLRVVVRSVIDKCITEGQLDNTRLTLQDLNKIADSFTKTLLGVYHQRIIYPEVPASITPRNKKPTRKEIK